MLARRAATGTVRSFAPGSRCRPGSSRSYERRTAIRAWLLLCLTGRRWADFVASGSQVKACEAGQCYLSKPRNCNGCRTSVLSPCDPVAAKSTAGSGPTIIKRTAPLDAAHQPHFVHACARFPPYRAGGSSMRQTGMAEVGHGHGSTGAQTRMYLDSVRQREKTGRAFLLASKLLVYYIAPTLTA